MSTFSVKVRKIEILPHPNADALELAKVDDYHCVVKKGQYKTGDLVVYIPEAAIVPEWILKKYGFWNEKENKGMLAGSKGDRVKAIKLRGELSLGIVIPVSALNNSDLHVEGVDVAEELGIVKYEPPIPVHMAGEVFNAGTRLTVNYDIENIKAWPDVFEDGEDVVVTEKIHGCADYDTIIDTLEFGPIKIGQVCDKKIFCHVKAFDITTNEVVYEKINGHSIFPNDKQWYEIETEDGQIIKLTENHLVWLPKLNCYREVKFLTENDEFLLYS
jgi:hypothetical protein